jgi:proteic killer suppression protein
MRIGSIRHKGLKRFYEAGNAAGLPKAAVEKIRNMLSFLSETGGLDELRAVPSWKAHQLTGDRKGTWALHVTRNWRLTFRVDDDEIVDLDYEDYH